MLMKYGKYEVNEDGLYKVLECYGKPYLKELILPRVVFEAMIENWGNKNKGDNADEESD